MNLLDRIGRFAIALVFGFSVGRAVADYDVTGYQQSFGTVSLPATFSGTANATTLQLAERSFSFTPSQSGTYQTKFTFLKGAGSSVLSCKCTMTPTGTAPTLITTDGSAISFQAGKRYSFVFQAASGDVSGTGYARGTTSSGVATGYYKFVVTIGSSSPAPTTTYTITYKPGSYGTGSQQTATKTKGQALTLKGAIFTRSGYTQKGWSTSTYGTSKTYALGGSYTTDAAVTLYPYWEKNADTVTLSKSSDLGHDYKTFTGSFTVTASSTWTLTQSVTESWLHVTKGGNKVTYTFDQNNTSDYRGCKFTVTCGSASASCQVNQAGRTIDVLFDANEGTINGDATKKQTAVSIGTIFSKICYVPLRTGYTYDGWSTSKTGSKISDDATLKSLVTDSQTLLTVYARWKSSTRYVSVTLNANGGQFDDGTTTDGRMYDASKTFGTLPTPTQSGFTFLGWFTQKSGGTRVYSTTTVSSAVGSSATSATIYAQWTENAHSADEPYVCGVGASSFGTVSVPFIVKGTYGEAKAKSFTFTAKETASCKVWLDSEDDDDSDYKPSIYLVATVSGGAGGCELKKTDVATLSFVKGNTYAVSLNLERYSATRGEEDVDFSMQFGGDELKIPFVGVPERVVAEVSGSNVEVSWSRVDGATKYIVYRQWNSGKTGGPYYGSQLAEVEAANLSYRDTSPIKDSELWTDTENWYYVRAVNDETIGRFSEASNEVHVPATSSSSDGTIVFGKGWTWFSVNVTPTDASFSTVFKGVTFADEDVIKSSDGSATYYSGKWYPSPSTFKLVPGRAYAVKKSTDGTATVTVSGSAAPTSLTVEKGWNWIGPTATKEVSLDALTHSVGFIDEDVIKSAEASATYYGGKWYGELKSLKPGVGYKAKFAKGGTIAFGK